MLRKTRLLHLLTSTPPPLDFQGYILHILYIKNPVPEAATHRFNQMLALTAFRRKFWKTGSLQDPGNNPLPALTATDPVLQTGCFNRYCP